MIVSHAHRFIFFHNPKCAGTSFRTALAGYHDDPFRFWGVHPAPFFSNRLDHTHIRLFELQQLFPHLLDCAADYASVIFVRNPYVRFLSAVGEHFRQFLPGVRLDQWAPANQARLVEGLVAEVLRGQAIQADYRFVHFSPQLWHIQLGRRIVPRTIIPLLPGRDACGEACQALGISAVDRLWHNASAVHLSHVVERPVVARFIRTFYAQDLEFFAADPALARLCEPPAEAPAAARAAQ